MNYTATFMNKKKANDISLLLFILALSRTSTTTTVTNRLTTKLIVRLNRSIFFAVCCIFLTSTDRAIGATIPPTHPPCNDNQFQCNRSGECLVWRQVCDHFRDCGDGDTSDEDWCPKTCPATDYVCENGQCVPYSFQDPYCDGQWHCSDKSDEQRCPSQRPPDPEDFALYPMPVTGIGCPREFLCTETYKCIDQSKNCDGAWDCTPSENSSSDELGCRACTAYEHQCKNGQCISITPGQNPVCDRVAQCIDGSDERNCPCLMDDFTCDNTGYSRRCLPQDEICDNKYDCLDKTDEAECCGETEFQCAGAGCIPESLHCDSNFDCQDYSDEDNCGSKNATISTHSGTSTGEKIGWGVGGTATAVALWGVSTVYHYRKLPHSTRIYPFRAVPKAMLNATFLPAICKLITETCLPAIWEFITASSQTSHEEARSPIYTKKYKTNEEETIIGE